MKSSETALADQQQQADALAEQIAAERIVLARLRAGRVGVADMVAEARGAVSVIRLRRRELDAKRSELKQQLAAVAMQRNYVEKLVAQRTLATKHSQLVATSAELAKESAPIEASIADRARQLRSQQNTVASLEQQFTATMEGYDRQQQTLAGLQEAIVHARTADAELGGNQLRLAIDLLIDQEQALRQDLATAQAQSIQRRQALEIARVELERRVVERDALVQQRASMQARVDERQRQAAEVKVEWDAAITQTELAAERLRASWEYRYAVRSLVPLTPEQLAGSTISGLGLMPRFRRQAMNEWGKNNKDKNNKDKKADSTAEKKAAAVATLVKKRTDQVTSAYVSMFAAPGGSPQDVFSATADQALFLSNDGRVQGWLAPSEGSLVKRLQSIEDPATVAEELHLAILSRPATAQEQADVAEYLADRKGDRGKGIQELAWGLLSSIEFRFNH